MSTRQKKSLRRLASTTMSALDSSPFNDEYIEHHGILGMRWGIRRFQNKDGSLKPAGKKRYNDSDSEPRDRGLAPGANSGSKGSSTGKLAAPVN